MYLLLFLSLYRKSWCRHLVRCTMVMSSGNSFIFQFFKRKFCAGNFWVITLVHNLMLSKRIGARSMRQMNGWQRYRILITFINTLSVSWYLWFSQGWIKFWNHSHDPHSSTFTHCSSRIVSIVAVNINVHMNCTVSDDVGGGVWDAMHVFVLLSLFSYTLPSYA